MAINLTENALRVLEKRYLKKVDGKVVETPEDMFRRVARNIAEVERNVYGKSEEETARIEEAFYRLMADLVFMPNSPTLMNAGRELQQLAACFVLPVEDSMVSIFDSVKYAALIHQSGGGTGFSFSRLRPKNDVVRSTGGVASGPVSFMKVFNAATDAVKQGGTRRGANMGILRVDHPDILEFITCKSDNNELTNFNISVAVTDEFMEAVRKDATYWLVNPRTRQRVKELRAREVFNLIVEMAWRNGEPGIIFIDRINRDNPTPALGEIESTNPCGEQPLLPFEACNLGSLNLSKFVAQGENGVREIDWQCLGEAVDIAVRFLDDVIDAGRYPLPEIDAMVKANRKIGLGVMGFADMLIKLRIPYDSDEAVEVADRVMGFIHERAREASRRLAEERGAFPNFGKSVYAEAGEPPIRNATVTTVAPTGTISIIAGCSSGIEPHFALCFVRNVLDNDKLLEVNPLFEEVARELGVFSRELVEAVAETGSVRKLPGAPEELRRLFATAHDVAPEWHVKIQAAFQRHTDNAVSKTVNLPHDASREDVERVYMLSYDLGCKGVTVYRDGSREGQVLSTPASSPAGRGAQGVPSAAGESAPPSQAAVGNGTGIAAEPKDGKSAAAYASEAAVSAGRQASSDRPSSSGIEPRQRPQVTTGRTEKVTTGCGNVYVTVNEDSQGLCEVFTSIGKSGGCAAAQSEAISRLISLALRAGVKTEAIIKHLRGIRCPSPAWQQGRPVLSCPDAIGQVLENYLHYKACGDDKGVQSATHKKLDGWEAVTGACPECGGHMHHESGCAVCLYCGYSKCS